MAPRRPTWSRCCPTGGSWSPGNTTAGANGIVWRLRSNGNPDTSFNETGARAIDSAGSEHLRALLVQPDGKLVAVGDTSVNKDGAFYRLTTDGQFDRSFDGDGAIGVDAGGTEMLTGAVLQADGNLVAVGSGGTGRGRGGVPPARRSAQAHGDHDRRGHRDLRRSVRARL